MDKELKISIPIEIEQYERKIYDLKQLIEISKGLNSTLEYNTLIDSILLTCMGQMQLLRAGIFLRKGIGFEDFTLHRNYKGFEIDHSIDYELHSDSVIVKMMEQDFKCYSIKEFEKNLGESYSVAILKTLSPSLIVPLMSKGEINGIIILGERINSRGFSESEKEYLLNIASLAGIAIHNATLYEMATTDMMTKLKIHHYFQTMVHEEMERSIKYERPLSIIMTDIDHFKKFNDTYGHSAGDMVLINVASTVMKSIRQMDIAARYGGEEFAIILPKTDINESLVVAERIRDSVEKMKFRWQDQDLSVTISIGLTQLDPSTDFVKSDLIKRADKALYMSKENGRNRVTFL